MSGDPSTEDVMDWLNFYKHPFIRINLGDFLDKRVSFSLLSGVFTIEGDRMEASEVNAVWYRRTDTFKKSTFFRNNQKQLVEQAIEQLNFEYASLRHSFATLFHDAYWLNHPFNVSVNKMHVLNKANQCGLSIPATHVVNTKDQLLTLMENQTLICKSIFESTVLEIDQATYMMYTEELTPEIVKNLEMQFYPSMVQKKIEKHYEIRIFYLDGAFYAMAIFSQSDAQTKLDFRHYNDDRPNRNVLYHLPQEVQGKLHRLMQALDLNCGSIDMIRGCDGSYYFLEVNPVGQYGMTAIPCNFNLDQLIAEHLIEKDHTYEKRKVF